MCMFTMQTVNGVPKPVYRSFQLLHALYSQSVLISTNGNIDVAVTVDASSPAVAVLIVNYNWAGLPVVDESVTLNFGGFAGNAHLSCYSVIQLHMVLLYPLHFLHCLLYYEARYL